MCHYRVPHRRSAESREGPSFAPATSTPNGSRGSVEHRRPVPRTLRYRRGMRAAWLPAGLVFLAWTVAGVACVGDDPVSDGDGGSNASSGQSGSGGAGSSGQASGSSSSSGFASSSSGAPGGGSSGGLPDGGAPTYIFRSHPVRGDFAANSSLSSFDTADALCKQDADAAGLTGAVPSVAILWYPDGNGSPVGGKERLPPGTAFFLPPSQAEPPSEIAKDLEELFNKGPSAPIDRLATGERVPSSGSDDGLVWTGANPPSGGIKTCDNWTAGDTSLFGWAGNAVSPPQGDTDAWISSSEQACDKLLRLYCVQSP